MLPAWVAAQTQPSSQPAETVLTSQQLLADADILQNAYEALHPGLYRYNTKSELTERFVALRKAFAVDRTRAQAFIELARFTAGIQCGHTYPNFYNQPKSVVNELFANRSHVPFEFRWVNRAMIITRNLSNSPQLVPGTEVLAINDVVATRLLEELLPLARADGGNDAKRLSMLERRGVDRYETFDIFFSLIHPHESFSYLLTIRRPGSSAVETVVARTDTPAGRANAASEDADTPAWKPETIAPGIVHLRMKTWALYNSKWDWKTSLHKTFDELIASGATHLVIDLRSNEGGLDVGNIIISRIATQPVKMATYGRFTRYRTTPPQLNAYLDTWDDSFKNWGDAAKPAEKGFYRLRRYDDDAEGDLIQPVGQRFAGKVIVLIDSSNSSATGQFAQVIKRNRLATLIGQTTGGNQRGINGGAFFFLRLPNSKIEVDLPIIATFPQPAELPDGQNIPFRDIPNAGIEPDIAVNPSIEDIAAGRDAELEAALSLCRSK